MERVRFILYKGREIFLLDFSGLNLEDVYPLIERSKTMIQSRPEQSLLTLTDVTNTRFDDALTNRLKQFTAENRPYVRAAAIVGISGLKKILLDAVMIFSKRKFHAFETIEQAKEWLVKN